MPESTYESLPDRPSILASRAFWLGGLLSVLVWTTIAFLLMRGL